MAGPGQRTQIAGLALRAVGLPAIARGRQGRLIRELNALSPVIPLKNGIQPPKLDRSALICGRFCLDLEKYIV
jgi:hypothetical protein